MKLFTNEICRFLEMNHSSTLQCTLQFGLICSLANTRHLAWLQEGNCGSSIEYRNVVGKTPPLLIFR